MANIKHPLDWFTLTKDDYVIERNRYLKLLPQMDQVKENNTYYLRVTITESKMFFNKISIKGILIVFYFLFFTFIILNYHVKKETIEACYDICLVNYRRCVLWIYQIP